MAGLMAPGQGKTCTFHADLKSEHQNQTIEVVKVFHASECQKPDSIELTSKTNKPLFQSYLPR